MTFHPRRRNPDAPHQVVLLNQSGSSKIYVSCNCRATHGTHDPIGSVETYLETARLYNDPTAHRRDFDPRDRIRIG